MTVTKTELRRIRAARKKHNGWINHWMSPLYGKGGCQEQSRGSPDIIYAPDVETAFKIAHTYWPTADGWVCHGVQDPADGNVCLS